MLFVHGSRRCDVWRRTLRRNQQRCHRGSQLGIAPGSSVQALPADDRRQPVTSCPPMASNQRRRLFYELEKATLAQRVCLSTTDSALITINDQACQVSSFGSATTGSDQLASNIHQQAAT